MASRPKSYAFALRQELIERNHAYAKENGLPHVTSTETRR